jgi:hypothetical protein
MCYAVGTIVVGQEGLNRPIQFAARMQRGSESRRFVRSRPQFRAPPALVQNLVSTGVRGDGRQNRAKGAPPSGLEAPAACENGVGRGVQGVKNPWTPVCGTMLWHHLRAPLATVPHRPQLQSAVMTPSQPGRPTLGHVYQMSRQLTRKWVGILRHRQDI